MTKKYSASLSRSQGRSGYSVIFRHPVRKDEATGKLGVRIRRGLGTRDAAEAERLRDELNTLLSEPRFHDPGARGEAERRFDPRVVDIFYYKLTPEEIDYVGLREAVIPLPPSEADGYRRVLLLGTTGAGKTTLVRQLIGTDPESERFPSTSTAKTTIHDTEIVLREGDWEAAVTFVSSDEAREYLGECISAAVLAASQGADDGAILRRLLNHVNQRFRFNYVLGNGPASEGGDFDDEDDVTIAEQPTADDLAGIDLEPTNQLLGETVIRLRDLAVRLSAEVRKDLDPQGKEDERVVEELFEDELDTLVREDDAFHEIADSLMDEIERRFELLPPGELRTTRGGWPLAWTGRWPVEERQAFLKAVSRFSSNYAPLFGRLLTPLVNGVRVAGPFKPSWTDRAAPKLVLLDGEGLGHTPRSSSAVSTAVSRRIEAVDAILLVDNATQPMQAAPLAAMREVVVTGNARKLVLAFTHFDEVNGDNLPTSNAKAQHVLASAENVLASFGEELGPFAERALRQRLEQARFFLSHIHQPLTESSTGDRASVKQLRKLLDALDRVVDRPAVGPARPVYDRMNLVLAVRAATEAFHEGWRPRLGLEVRSSVPKEHWTRVKALSRRLAKQMADEYDSLRPVADLRKALVESIYVFAQSPLRWEGIEPDEDQKQALYDSLADGIARRLLILASRRVWADRIEAWQEAYDKHGGGSSFVRAQIIGNDIYETAAPVPTVAPSPDRNVFLREVVDEVESAVEEAGAALL